MKQENLDAKNGDKMSKDSEQDVRISNVENKLANLAEKVTEMALEMKGIRLILIVGFSAMVGVDMTGILV
jgi:hypothetical protein